MGPFRAFRRVTRRSKSRLMDRIKSLRSEHRSLLRMLSAALFILPLLAVVTPPAAAEEESTS